jgi:hypothetical protein
MGGQFVAGMAGVQAWSEIRGSAHSMGSVGRIGPMGPMIRERLICFPAEYFPFFGRKTALNRTIR